MSEIERRFTIAFDIRGAYFNINSGLARVIVGLSSAIAEELNKLKQKNKTLNIPKLLLVSNTEVPDWAMDIVKKYPQIVSFWMGAKVSDLSKDKPIYRWAIEAYKYIKFLTNNNFIWVATRNFDRPAPYLGILAGLQPNNIIQIIYDVIPFEHKKNVGFLFGMQFRFKVRQALRRLPFLVTISTHSANKLKKLYPSRNWDIAVLPLGIESNIGSYALAKDDDELIKMRKDFLLNSLKIEDDLTNIVHAKWVIGVGREEVYKRWNIAKRAVQSCDKEIKNGVWFIRISTNEFYKDAKKNIINNEEKEIKISELNDDMLAKLYTLCDVLLHPSVAEGFGLPPLEAALSGLPVIFASNTAVAEHFEGIKLPRLYWQELKGSEGEWSIALLETLKPNEELNLFKQELKQVKNVREYIIDKYKTHNFSWSETGTMFVNNLRENANLINLKIDL